MVQTFLLNEISENEIKPIIEFERFSDFSKLIRATALVFKFINKCKKVKKKIKIFNLIFI